jgi:hypothetical protein
MRARIEEHEDDPAAVDEMPLDCADAVVRADEVRGDEVVEAVARARGVRPADPAARDQGECGPVCRGGDVDGPVDRRAVADVARLDVCAARLGSDRLEPVALSREHRQAGALAREPERDGPADSGAGAGDDDVTIAEARIDVYGRRL